MSGSQWDTQELRRVEELNKLYPFDYKKIAYEVGRTPRGVRYAIQEKLGLRNEKPQQPQENLEGFLKLFNDFKRGAEGGKLGKRRPANFTPRDFTITPEFMLYLFIKQGGKCYLSGVKITLPSSVYEFNKRIHTASIDRIDSSLGYIEENVCWVHKEVNMLKGTVSNEKLLYWSRKISENMKDLYGK